MRLIELRLKNLNSLKGEWHIDFTDPAFINEGIFAITGQTGAGKTTILDAICLALYGETPRINSISKNSNEVMTRQTADCFAEVVIDLNGSQYRCRWGQRRAYGKSDGNLQDATHEIASVKPKTSEDLSNHEENSDVVGDEILESKLSRTKDKIIELTRMDFQQFTRSILLAQGSFSAFLKAKADERADILEKITGTDIYATISTHVHEKKRAEEEILNKLQFGLEGLTLLDTTEESALSESLKTNQLAQHEQQQTLGQLTAQIMWLDAVNELTQQVAHHNNDFEKAQQAQQDFIPETQRLLAANKALELDSQYSQLNHNRDMAKRLRDEQQALTDSLPAQQVNLEQTLIKLNMANEFAKQSEYKLQTTLPILVKVRTLDADIKQQTYTLADNNLRKDAISNNVQRLSQEIANHVQLQGNSKLKLASTDKFLDDHSELHDLDTDIATFDSHCSRLKALVQDNASLATDKLTATKQEVEYQAELDKRVQQQVADNLAMAGSHQQLNSLEQQQAVLVTNHPLTNMRAEQEQIEQINNQIEQVNFKLQQIAKLDEQSKAIHSALPIIRAELTRITNLIAENEATITEAKDKRQDKQQHLNLLQKVAKLEDYIVDLQDNDPCPLCGATEHPYGKHHPFLEKNNKADQSTTIRTQQHITELDTLIDNLQQALSAHRIDHATKLSRITQQQQQLIPLHSDVQTLTNDIQNRIIALIGSKSSLEIETLYTEAMNAIIQPLSRISADIDRLNNQSDINVAKINFVDNSLFLINDAKQQLAKQRQYLKSTLTQYEAITASRAAISKTIETDEQQRHKLASAISVIETDIKLNALTTASLDNKTAANFNELSTTIATVSSLTHKYPIAKYESQLIDVHDNALSSNLLSQQSLLALVESIDKQAVLSGIDCDQHIESLRQQRSRLAQLKKQFNAHKDCKQTLLTALGSLDSQINTKQAQLNNENAELEKFSELITDKTLILRQLHQQRKEDFADKNPDEEENRLRVLFEQAKTEQTTAQRLHDQTAQTLHHLQKQQQQLTAQLKSTIATLDSQQNDFATVLTLSQFTDEAAFVAARLPMDKRNELSQQQQQIDYALQQAQSLLKQTNQTLADKQSNPLTIENRETLANRQQQTQEDSKRLLETIGAMSQQLKDNNDKRSTQQAKLEAITVQKDKLQVWQQLHKLIGSADGKKYRTFAQGLTFDIMVNHANTQLHKMSDRYLLIRDESNALELNVIDNYQGGEIRSTKNLSGGEGFIISLALALGLSQMASHNIRVDSLFLDEGFGTLDDESLDIALDTLTCLQQEGKLIGVISHVQALKERILTQIQVKKLSGGFSQITGQGCHKIAS